MTEIDIEIEADPVRSIGVPATSVDVLILNGPAKLAGWSLRDASGDIPLENESNVTSPGALAAICTISGIAAGTYNVSWSVGLAGTLGAGDANNFVLQRNGVTVVQSANGAAAGEYPQVGFQITLAQGDNLIIKAIAAGTVGAIYSAAESLVPTVVANALVEIQDGNNPLAEVSLGAGGADSRTYTDQGIHIRNRINLHVISGSVTGAILARFQKNTG